MDKVITALSSAGDYEIQVLDIDPHPDRTDPKHSRAQVPLRRHHFEKSLLLHHATPIFLGREGPDKPLHTSLQRTSSCPYSFLAGLSATPRSSLFPRSDLLLPDDCGEVERVARARLANANRLKASRGAEYNITKRLTHIFSVKPVKPDRPKQHHPRWRHVHWAFLKSKKAYFLAASH